MTTRRVARKVILLTVLIGGAIVAPPVAAAEDPPGSAGRKVYVVTSGHDISGGVGPHVASAHTIGANGALTPFGKPVEAGDGARAIVLSPDGRYAYLAASLDNTVHAYTVDADGGLAPLSTVDSGGERPFGVAISPDGRTLYVANLQSETGTVSVFGVRSNGTLQPRSEPVETGSVTPRNVAVSPDGRFLFVSHGAPVDEVPDVINTFEIQPDGTLGRRYDTNSNCATGAGMVTSPDGRFLYVACMNSDAVFGFGIGADGTLKSVPGTAFPAAKTPEGLAMAPDGRHLFVASVATAPQHLPDEDGVRVFAIGDDGALTQRGPRVEAEDGPVGIATTPDGRWLYTGNFFTDDGMGNSNVSGFGVDRSSGLLTEVPGSPFPASGKAPAFDAVTVAPNQGPVAKFSATAHPAGRPSLFDARASADSDGRIARYDWDFGDGTVLRDGGPRPVHTYRTPGTYRVTLVVTDDETCSTSQVFTGRSALCNGTSAARADRSVTIPRN